MNIIVTGSAGLLGSNLCPLLQDTHTLIGFYNSTPPSVQIQEKRRVDLRNVDEVKRAVTDTDPDVIIHCAALTNVERCEKEHALAREVNALGTRNLVASAQKKCTFVYVSTDQVFNGKKKGAYTEEDIPDPINVYARTKLEGERFVQEYSNKYIIVRTNFFGLAPPGRLGAIQWIRNELKARKSITMVSDWYYSPILINDLVDIVLQLIEGDSVGVYNVSSSDSCSKYDFGIAVAQELGLDTSLIQEGSLGDLRLSALRPQNMVLDVSKTEHAIHRKLYGYREYIQQFHGLLSSEYAQGFLST
jgi:dTDP-4-dehydrorhamnose reductase